MRHDYSSVHALTSTVCWIVIAVSHCPAYAKSADCRTDPVCADHIAQAFDLDRQKKYESALAEFESAYRIHPEPRIIADIGRTLHRLGKYAQAIAHYQRAAAAELADEELRRTLGFYIEEAQRRLPPSRVPAKQAGVARTTQPAADASPTAAAPQASAHTCVVVSDTGETGPGCPESPPRLGSTTTALAPTAHAYNQTTVRLSPPLHKRWWFWTILGSIVVGSVAASVALATQAQRPATPPADDGRCLSVIVPCPGASL